MNNLECHHSLTQSSSQTANGFDMISRLFGLKLVGMSKISRPIKEIGR